MRLTATFLLAAALVAGAACREQDETLPGFTAFGGGVASGGGGHGAAGGAAGGAGGVGAGGQGGAGATAPGPEPAPWSAPGTQDDVAFAWSVQTGDATPTSVMVSLRTLEPVVSLTVMKGVEAGWEQVAAGTSYDAVEGVVGLELEGLAADTTYSLAFYAPDGDRRSRVARFRTALAEGARRVLRFGATSGLRGETGSWNSLRYTVPERLDFFLLLGDTIYADFDPSPFDYEQHYLTALATRGLADMTAGAGLVATWDDHEVDNNWSWSDSGIQEKFDAGLAAFRRAIPQRQGPGGTGIWRKLAWGAAADLFVLDCRGERDGEHYISPEQMSWLKQELSASQARFKLIVNSVPIFDFSGTVVGSIQASDRWQGYPEQRDEILEHIDSGITGVLWVSGDVHFGLVGRVGTSGEPGASAWDVFAGPTSSPINPASYAIPESDRIPVVVSNHHYTLFEADPTSGLVQIQYIGDEGEVLRQLTLQL